MSSAFLMGVRLPKGKLARANFDGADARNSDLTGSRVTDASLRSANFRGARLEEVSFAGSVFERRGSCWGGFAQFGFVRGESGEYGFAQRGFAGSGVGIIAEREGRECVGSEERAERDGGMDDGAWGGPKRGGVR